MIRCFEKLLMSARVTTRVAVLTRGWHWSFSECQISSSIRTSVLHNLSLTRAKSDTAPGSTPRKRIKRSGEANDRLLISEIWQPVAWYLKIWNQRRSIKKCRLPFFIPKKKILCWNTRKGRDQTPRLFNWYIQPHVLDARKGWIAFADIEAIELNP